MVKGSHFENLNISRVFAFLTFCRFVPPCDERRRRRPRGGRALAAIAQSDEHAVAEPLRLRLLEIAVEDRAGGCEAACAASTWCIQGDSIPWLCHAVIATGGTHEGQGAVAPGVAAKCSTCRTASGRRDLQACSVADSAKCSDTASL